MARYRMALQLRDGEWSLAFAREDLVPMTETFTTKRDAWKGAKEYLDVLGPADTITCKLGERVVEDQTAEQLVAWLRGQWKRG